MMNVVLKMMNVVFFASSLLLRSSSSFGSSRLHHGFITASSRLHHCKDFSTARTSTTISAKDALAAARVMVKAPHQVSFQWKNPDFQWKNVDFQWKNVDFQWKNPGFITNPADGGPFFPGPGKRGHAVSVPAVAGGGVGGHKNACKYSAPEESCFINECTYSGEYVYKKLTIST